MHKENLIPANEFCANHHIEISFINLLNDNGLIEITTIEETVYIRESQLKELEKIVRLYFELDINIEGIETVIYLLHRIINMQNEIIHLKNKLRLYEGDEL
jgi:chaperone modulatory protein CbpM